MATIKTDNFTEASDTALESHTSDSGGGWRGEEEFMDVIAATNSLSCDNADINTAIGDEAPSETDYFVEATGILNGESTSHRWGIVARGQDGATHAALSSSYYFVRMTGAAFGSVTWNFFKVVSGTVSSLGISGTTSGTKGNVDLDDEVKLKMTVQGTGATVTITLEYDENIDGGGFSGYSSLSTITDTGANRITSAGDVGVYLRGTSARISYFNAEDLTSGSVAPQSYYYRYSQ